VAAIRAHQNAIPIHVIQDVVVTRYATPSVEGTLVAHLAILIPVTPGAAAIHAHQRAIPRDAMTPMPLELFVSVSRPSYLLTTFVLPYSATVYRHCFGHS
jgi:hypothetical protein